MGKRLQRPLRLSRRRAAATRSLPAIKLPPQPAALSTLPQPPAAPPFTSRQPPPALSTLHRQPPAWLQFRALTRPLLPAPRLHLPLTPPLARRTLATSLITRRV